MKYLLFTALFIMSGFLGIESHGQTSKPRAAASVANKQIVVVPACQFNEDNVEIGIKKRYYAFPQDGYPREQEALWKYEWISDWDSGSSNIIVSHPELSFSKIGPHLINVTISSPEKVICQSSWLLQVLPNRYGTYVQQAARSFADKLEIRLAQGFGDLKGSKQYPVKIQIDPSSTFGKKGWGCKVIGDLAISMADTPQGGGSSTGFVAIGNATTRITSGSMSCSDVEETAGVNNVRFLSGTLIDTGSVEFETGSHAEVNGVGLTFNGKAWITSDGKEFASNPSDANSASDISKIAAIITSVSHQPSLVAMAVKSKDPDIRKAAIEAISTQRFLLQAALDSPDNEIAKIAVARITTNHSLADIAANASSPVARAEAQKKLQTGHSTPARNPLPRK